MKTVFNLTLIAVFLFGTQAMANEGGPEKGKRLKQWISDNMSYPAEAAELAEEGTVYVYFELIQGKPSHITVIRSVSASLDAAAVKTITDMPLDEWSDFEPLEENKYVLPIKFEIK